MLDPQPLRKEHQMVWVGMVVTGGHAPSARPFPNGGLVRAAVFVIALRDRRQAAGMDQSVDS